jgi:DNA-damage-inducible protein J
VDEQIKLQATEILAAMGLSIADAVRVFLRRVVGEKQMPFALRVPNAETRAAMAQADEIAGSRRARFGNASELFDDLEKSSVKSTAKYNREVQANSDGRLKIKKCSI